MSKQFPMLSFQHLDIHGQVVCCGAEAGVAKQFLYGAQVTAIFKHVGGHAGAQEVRILPLPGFALVGGDDAVIAASDAQGASGVAINDLPYGAAAGEGFASMGDEQDGGFAWAECAPEFFPAIDELVQFFGYGQITVDFAFSLVDVDKEVIHDITGVESHDLAGACAGFVSNPHDDMVTESDGCSEVWCSQEGSGFIFSKYARQALGGAARAWHKLAEVVFRVLAAVGPAIKAAQRGELQVDRGQGYFVTPFTHVLIERGIR